MPAIKQMALMMENLTSNAPRIWCDQSLLQILTERGRDTIPTLLERKIILSLCLPCPNRNTLSCGRIRRFWGGWRSFISAHASNILLWGWMTLEMEIVSMAEGLRFWREQKGLYAGGVTPYPIYIESKPVTFNPCKFPISAADKTVLAQFPTPSATARFE